MNYTEEIDDLLEKAGNAKKYSSEHEQILTKALQLAELHQDRHYMVPVKMEYIQCLVFMGYQETALPHFVWLLSQIDNKDTQHEIDFFKRLNILFMYKWFIGDITKSPNVLLTRIHALMDDMENRFMQMGSSNRRTVLDYRRRVAASTGNREEARRQFELFEQEDEGRGWLADCEACVLSSRLGYLFSEKRYAEVVEQAAPILLGESKCHNVPKHTYPTICLSYLRLGDIEKATEIYEKGIKLIEKDEQCIGTYSTYLDYLVKVGRAKEGVPIIELNFEHVKKTMNKKGIMFFFWSAKCVFLQLKADGHPDEITLNLAENDYIYHADNQYRLSELIEYFDKSALNLAAQFDARNGNDYYTKVSLPAADFGFDES